MTDAPEPDEHVHAETMELLGRIDSKVRDKEIPAPSRKDLRDLLCRDVPYLLDFLEPHRLEPDGTVFTDRLRRDAGYTTAVAEVRDVAKQILWTVYTLKDGYSEDIGIAVRQCAGRLRAAHASVRVEMTRLVNEMPETAQDDKLRRDSLELIDRHTEHFQAREAVAELVRASEESRRTLENQKQAAAQTATVRMSHFFTEHATAERRAANVLRLLSAALFAVAATFTITLVLVVEDPAEFANEMTRLLAAIPLVLLATYLARESTKHRNGATWAARLAITLQTLPAYAEGDSDRSGDYWMMMGRRLFGSDPAGDESSRRPADGPDGPRAGEADPQAVDTMVGGIIVSDSAGYLERIVTLANLAMVQLRGDTRRE